MSTWRNRNESYGGNVMDPKALASELKSFKVFFDRSTACLTEEDASFAPV
jgi:hypothetical protein